MDREATDLAGVRHLAYETLGSTNAEALALARAGERGPLWVSAQRQSAGRGRRGRTWMSAPGNLSASLLLYAPAPAANAAELSFVAALAVRDAIAEAAPALERRLTFKWPNDVLLAGEKAAGILIEGDAVRGEAAAVVVGIGVNCASHPVEAAFPATDLRAHGVEIGPQRLLESLAAAMATRLAQWDRGRGFAETRRAWLAAAHAIGTPIRVTDIGRERSGRFAGLDASGRLLLDLPDGGREEIAAGDVFPLTPRGGPHEPVLRG